MPPCLRSSRVEEMLYLLDPRRTLDASRVAKLAQNRQVSPTEGHVKHSNKTRLSQKRRYQRMQKIFLAHIGMLTSNTPSLVLKTLTSRSFLFLRRWLCIAIANFPCQRFYNKTDYSGLESHIINSYTNCLVQTLHYSIPIRQLAESHILTNCNREHCLLCELGFVMKMLEDARGINCQASNFCKTIGVLAHGMFVALHV